MIPFDDVPGRPDGPDFWLLSDVMFQLDAWATEDGRTLPEIVGDLIDMRSLHWMADQRVMRGADRFHLDPTDETMRLMTALYLEAFVMGARYQQRKGS